MSSSNQGVLLVLLATLFALNNGLEISTKPTDIIDGLRDVLIREGDGISGSVRSQTNQSPLDQCYNTVSQIIKFLNCGPFQLSPNSHLEISLDYSSKEFVLSQKCDRYFEKTQKNVSSKLECNYKTWIYNPIDCKRATCPPLTAPPGGFLSTSENTSNTTVYFWCSDGFNINGTDKVFCKENGLWDLPPPICQGSYCRPLLSPRHGFVSSQEDTPVNQTVEFSCESDYSLIGGAVLRCLPDGRWNAIAPVCKKMCIVPNITNQSEGLRSVPSMRHLSIGSLIEQGQRVIFPCKQGYTLSSSGFSTCIGGTWRPPIQCTKTCDAVKITNGVYTLAEDSSTIEYTCNPGFELIGQQKLLCTRGLTWDSEPPICTNLCTLSKQRKMISFRHTETYKVIPFGKQIINGTKVVSVCQSDTPHPHQNDVIECVNGELIPPPCRDPNSRLRSGVLELFSGGEWVKVCRNAEDVCNVLGYKKMSNKPCPLCSVFYMHHYVSVYQIRLRSKKRRSMCIRCS